jgi:GT2 family glycosyltransferase
MPRNPPAAAGSGAAALSVTAIVPATDRPPTLARCVEAIRAVDEPPEELIVVDDFPGGPAQARNAGARRATGDVLLFVDADVVLHRDAVSLVRAALGAPGAPSAVFGAYDDDPPARGAVSGFRNLLHHHVHCSSPGRAETFWAGVGAIRRDVFLAAGGFDEERYPRASIEDVELGLRLTAGGAAIRLDPAIRGTHLKAWTLASMVETDFARRALPWAELLVERGPSRALNLGWRHRLSALASLGIVASAAARRPRDGVLSTAALVGLNLPLYRLVLRRRGAAQTGLAVGLHALHHVTAVAALPVGALRARRRVTR